MHYVYFALSLTSNKIFVGLTSKSPQERVQEHNSGTSQWTRGQRPLKLLYYESYLCKEDAIAREKHYKSGFGKKIKRYIANGLLKQN